MFGAKKDDKTKEEEKEQQEEDVSKAAEDLSFLLDLGNDMNAAAPKLRVTGIYGDITEERCSETLYSMLLLQKSGTRLEPSDPDDPESELVEVYDPFEFFYFFSRRICS